ncbi:MAG: hypothetical protein RQ751_14780, partial [Longimicrobiales bacterium]|nr:hypothetical protein [Longimicrobiales bacterium]
HDGRIYVCDTRLAAIVVLDLEGREFDLWSPVDDGQLREPVNCAVDPADGRLFVTDTGRGEIVVFGPDRRFLGAFAGGEGARPVDVSVDDSLAWVADFGRSSVAAYDRRDFTPVRTLPADPADSAAALYGPMSVWAGPEAVYVSDFGAFHVQVYARDGTWLRTVGQLGRTPG